MSLIWSCTGAYDKQAFAELTPVFTSSGESFGFVLTWGYRDGRTFTEHNANEDKARQSGLDWVMGCDWLDAPASVREMYVTKESYISGVI